MPAPPGGEECGVTHQPQMWELPLTRWHDWTEHNKYGGSRPRGQSLLRYQPVCDITILSFVGYWFFERDTTSIHQSDKQRSNHLPDFIFAPKLQWVQAMEFCANKTPKCKTYWSTEAIPLVFILGLEWRHRLFHLLSELHQKSAQNT